ncbi:hypothetical protein CYMTET_45653, partial [Cymbomonas tetramitiformis]
AAPLPGGDRRAAALPGGGSAAKHLADKLMKAIGRDKDKVEEVIDATRRAEIERDHVEHHYAKLKQEEARDLRLASVETAIGHLTRELGEINKHMKGSLPKPGTTNPQFSSRAEFEEREVPHFESEKATTTLGPSKSAQGTHLNKLVEAISRKPQKKISSEDQQSMGRLHAQGVPNGQSEEDLSQAAYVQFSWQATNEHSEENLMRQGSCGSLPLLRTTPEHSQNVQNMQRIPPPLSPSGTWGRRVSVDDIPRKGGNRDRASHNGASSPLDEDNKSSSFLEFNWL